MLTKIKISTLLLSVLVATSACELTEDELSNLDQIIGEDQNPGIDFDHGPLAPNCYEKTYRQAEAEISKKVDLLFVVDTSGSLNQERQQIGAGVDAFLEALPGDVDVNIGVSLAHVGTRSGKLYRKDNDKDLVLKSSQQNTEEIRTQLERRMRYTVSEGESDGGEAMLYSFDQMLKPENLELARNEGLFRENSALVVVFVTDEQDICARYPAGVTPVFDGDRKEIPAFNNYCGNVTPESVNQKLRIVMQDKPSIVAGIVYHENSVVPSGGENEIAYGIIEMIEQSAGAMIDLSGGNFHEGLEQIGSLAVKKLNLKTEFQLSSSSIDSETVKVKVDNEAVAYQLNELNSVIILTDYAGIENSEVYIQFCEPVDGPNPSVPIISNFLVADITGGTARVTWETDIDATSQVEITHNASGSSVLTNLSGTGKKLHDVKILGLNPDTLYSVRGISVSSSGLTVKSESATFRTTRSLN